LQQPFTTGLTRLITSSEGITYFDALDVCGFYKIDAQANRTILDRWDATLKRMPFDPEHVALEGSLWIPFVMIISFLQSLGLKREQIEPSETLLEETKHLRGLAFAMAEDQFANTKRVLA